MKALHLAVVGFGGIGQACARAIQHSDGLYLSGIVRRPDHVATPLPDPFRKIPVVSQIAELSAVDGALVCVTPAVATDVGRGLLQQRVPIVDCTRLEPNASLVHKRALHRFAIHHKVPVIVSAGWDPGFLSICKALFSILTPKGHTEFRRCSGGSLHHSVCARQVDGVRDALCLERRTREGTFQRYVYVELDADANAERVVEAITLDPLFREDETFVFPVESIAALEERGYGEVLERWGSAGGTGHQYLMMEAHFDGGAMTAQMMVAAARALSRQKPGCWSILDIPVAQMCPAADTVC